VKTAVGQKQHLIKQSAYILPNFITILSLIFSMASIAVSNEARYSNNTEKFALACYFIIIASVCDFLDGFAARITKTQSLFGMQLDSLCDLVAFGVAPGILAYNFALHEFRYRGLIVCTI